MWRPETGCIDRGSNPGGGEILRTASDRPWDPLSLLYSGNCVSFPGVERPGRGVDHSTPSSAEVKERVELCLYSLSGPAWPVLGWPLPSICPYPESNQSNSLPLILYLKIHFNGILLSTSEIPDRFFSLRVSHQDSVCTSVLPHTCYMPKKSHSSWFVHSDYNMYLIWGVVCYCWWRCVGYICLLISFYLPTAICCLIILVYLTMFSICVGHASWTAVHNENDEFKLCGRKRSCHLWVSFSVFVLRECAATQNALGTSGAGAATKADDL